MFDPVKKRESLESPALGYRRSLQRPVEHGVARGCSAVNNACACCFCGLDEGTRLLAEFSQRLLTEADQLGRIASHSPHNRGHAFRSLALSHWLLTGEDDYQSLEASALEYWDGHNVEGLQPDGHILDSYLPYYLFAEHYEYVSLMYEHFTKGKEPKRLKTVRTSRVAAYVWAQYKLGRDGYNRETAEQAAKSYLDKKLGESLLGRGHFSRAAIWLKILYWNDIENPPSPRDVLRKAYDHMPEVTKPF